MPLKDGSPNLAERRDAERIAANARFIADSDDARLAELAADPLLRDDAVVTAQIESEVNRRKECALKRYRLTGNYGTFEITKVVEAEDEDCAFEHTGIMADLMSVGWEVVSAPDGEEWIIEEVT